MKVVEKLWGKEYWYVNEPQYCFKRLVLAPGFSSSLHYHKVKKETFLVWSGRCHLNLWARGRFKHYLLEPGHEPVTIDPMHAHQFWLEKDATEPAVIYEVSTMHDDEDVVREIPSRQL